MSLNGFLMLLAGFVGGLFASKHELADYDGTIKKFKKIWNWIVSKFSKKSNEKEEKNDRDKE